jgi:large subunit ribosomal protein L21
MYAIVRTGGRQYRAEPGHIIDVEKMTAAEGEVITLTDVLLVVPDSGAPIVGRPTVTGAAVQATVLGNYRAQKVLIWKYRPGLRYRKRRAHRQTYTRLKIESVTV